MWVNSCGGSTGQSSTEPMQGEVGMQGTTERGERRNVDLQPRSSLLAPLGAGCTPRSPRPSRSPRSPRSRGLTLVEVLVALVILGVGILALTGSSSLITRMIGRGKAETHAAMAASQRMEKLRLAARAGPSRCTSSEFASGGPVIEDGLTQSWTVSPGGSVRQVRVTVTYLTVRGIRSAVLETTIAC